MIEYHPLPRVQNALLLHKVLSELGDARSRSELKQIFCENEPDWPHQTFAAALREAIRRGWVSRIKEPYGVYYVASKSDRVATE